MPEPQSGSRRRRSAHEAGPSLERVAEIHVELVAAGPRRIRHPLIFGLDHDVRDGLEVDAERLELAVLRKRAGETRRDPMLCVDPLEANVWRHRQIAAELRENVVADLNVTTLHRFGDGRVCSENGWP